MENKEKICFEFTQEGIVTDLRVSSNFNTEELIFDDLADYLAMDHNSSKNNISTHLSLLEKLEILCKKTRKYANEESDFADNYKEIKFLVKNDNYSLENSQFSPFGYNSIKLLNNSLILVGKDSLFGLITIQGTEILPMGFDEIFLLDDFIIQTLSNNTISLYNTEGEKLFSDLDEVSENFNPFGFGQNYFWLKKDKKWGLFDFKLRQLLPFALEYDYCELITDNFKENVYIKVFKDGKCGLLNGLLNVEVIELDSDIEDIILNNEKNYIITKRTAQKTEILQSTLDKIEENIRQKN